jgi:hypothetical protein
MLTKTPSPANDRVSPVIKGYRGRFLKFTRHGFLFASVFTVKRYGPREFLLGGFPKIIKSMHESKQKICNCRGVV